MDWAVCPKPKTVSSDRRRECRLSFVFSNWGEERELELVEKGDERECWREEGRERMALCLCKGRGEILRDVFRSNFGIKNLEVTILLFSSLWHFSSFLMMKTSSLFAGCSFTFSCIITEKCLQLDGILLKPLPLNISEILNNCPTPCPVDSVQSETGC